MNIQLSALLYECKERPPHVSVPAANLKSGYTFLLAVYQPMESYPLTYRHASAQEKFK